MAGRSWKEMIDASTAKPLDSKIIKATDSTLSIPKPKHMEAILLFTHLPDYNMGKVVESLLQRTQEHSAVVVLKTLIVVHRLIRDGHERFTQFLATDNTNFNLSNFVDATSPDALSMSGFIRSYADYLEQKILTYRQLGFDICHVNANQHLERMPSDTPSDHCKNLRVFLSMARKLLICVSERSPDAPLQVQSQGHGAFAVEIKIPPAHLFSNDCIKGATKLLLKDILKIFVVMNAIVVNILEQFFSLQKKEASECLATYEEFVIVCADIDVFFAKCKAGQILDGRHIPELTAAPKVLLPAMKNYVENYGTVKQSSEEVDTVAHQMNQVRLAGSGFMDDSATEC